MLTAPAADGDHDASKKLGASVIGELGLSAQAEQHIWRVHVVLRGFAAGVVKRPNLSMNNNDTVLRRDF